MAAGLLAYGIWRVADATFDIERHGDDHGDVMERLGAGASGIVHFVLAWQAVRLMRGAATAMTPFFTTVAPATGAGALSRLLIERGPT